MTWLRRHGAGVTALITMVGCLVIGPVNAVASSPRATTGVTWKLVARTCTSGQAEAGRGCWDQQATDLPTWTVNEDSATWMDTTFGAQYEWHVPESITASKAEIPLNVTANDYTNNSGIAAQLCVASPFPTTPTTPGDPCARATAPS